MKFEDLTLEELKKYFDGAFFDSSIQTDASNTSYLAVDGHTKANVDIVGNNILKYSTSFTIDDMTPPQVEQFCKDFTRGFMLVKAIPSEAGIHFEHDAYFLEDEEVDPKKVIQLFRLFLDVVNSRPQE